MQIVYNFSLFSSRKHGERSEVTHCTLGNCNIVIFDNIVINNKY